MMFQEMTMNEMMNVNGGLPEIVYVALSWTGGILSGATTTGAYFAWEMAWSNAHTPYTKTVTRGGKKYVVTYNGKPGY